MDPNTKKDHDDESNSPTELFASAKVVEQSAMSAFRGETDKVDKAKAADAADDLLHGASKYGKLENNQYVEKAEGYLHQYSGKTPEAEKPSDQEKPAPPPEKKEEEESSGGGFGGVMKMAQGFMK
ncbi:hypothetical protein LUZ60_012101 [Juncus effusus]|nr:hypothetical protein LUZ60_012101 [Juncus effusus]